jgi:hypothetical protein
MQNLDQARDRAAHGFTVARVEMRPQAEVVVDDLGEVVFAQLTQCFGQVIHHESVVIGEVLVLHLRDLPAREIEVQSVDEGHVVANDIGHRGKEVPSLDHHVDGLLGVAEHRHAGIPGHGLLPALELA